MSMKQAAGYLFTGAMVGAAVALLCAPQSGAQTTKDIRKFSRKTVARLGGLQANIRDEVTGWVEDVTELVKDGKSRIEHLIKTA